MPSSCTGPATGLPATSIAPSVVGSSPAIMLSSVLLPQPLGPTIETNSPRPIVRLTSSTACTSPWRERKRFDTPRTATAGMALAIAAPSLGSSAPSPRRGEGRGEGLSVLELRLIAPLTGLGEFTIGRARRDPVASHPLACGEREELPAIAR